MTDPEPLLRTLAPLLANLASLLREWKTTRQTVPLTIVQKSVAEGLLADLQRRSEALQVERLTLVIALMGGTGVGKSTLLNALAGSPIAAASFTRPTTREPVVYYHHSLRPENLEPALRHCRLVAHERDKLIDKVLVDTPDLDSNDLSNRDRLLAALPAADVVLYVGSQEKYHDRLGWDIFKKQRERSAFAFVLNKWDRCLHNVAAGVRPDADLIRDLKAEGFDQPVIFRTVASHWIDNPKNDPAPVEGEQFPDLVMWLENGLNKLEIEAIKARGIGQLLAQLERMLRESMPPDWTENAKNIERAWEGIFAEEGQRAADQLMQTLDRHQREIEHHFRVEGQRRFKGLMAAYMGLATKFRTLGSSLRDQVPLAGRFLGSKEKPAEPTAVILFIQSCVTATGERVLEKRLEGMSNRLLVAADQGGMPAAPMNGPIEAERKDAGAAVYEKSLLEAWRELDSEMSNPNGAKRFLQVGLIQLSNTLPGIMLVAGYLWLMFDFFVQHNTPSLFQMMLPILLTFILVLMLQGLSSWLLPFRWSAVRERFHSAIANHLTAALKSQFGDIPGTVAAKVTAERSKTEAMHASAKEVVDWLAARENSIAVRELYGRVEETKTEPEA